MAFDGIVTKKVTDELKNLIDYKIDKIYQPDKNTIILGIYGNFTNLALLACISPNNYRIHLTTHTIKNPTIAPNFCMLLRKYILGYKVKNIYTKSLERIVFIELENLENPDKISKKTLVIELMGKHSNIILLDENGVIIDSIRHTSTEENAQRDIYPTARYFEPASNKLNLLETKNFEDFYKKLEYNNAENSKDTANFFDSNYKSIVKSIADEFNGIGITNLNTLANTVFENDTSSYHSSKNIAHILYDKIIEFINEKNLTIKITVMKNKVPKDYCLCKNQNNKTKFSLNFALDDFYFSKETNELFTNYRNTLLNIILSTLKKYEKRLTNIDEKLSECAEMNKYKLYGELIVANLYKIPNYKVSSISLENYYDNNSPVEIPLDKKYTPQHNAKRFFKKYNKLKNALEIVSVQKEETLEDINYIESIVYELDNCSNLDDVQEVYNEISENEIFKNMASSKSKKNDSKKTKQMTKNKFASFNPLKFVIDGYTIYVGRNNKENDYLTNKFASKNDIWFHTKDIHGSHVILKTISGEIVPDNIIFEAAKLAASHSKAKNSSNVPVDYCLVKYVKKIPRNKPGLVTYKNNKTILC